MGDPVKVCEEWFPASGNRTAGFAMDSDLKEQIDTCITNVVNDWDFVFIITGGGEVRVGKSVLGLQILTYWNYAMWKTHGIKPSFDVNKNIVFNWDKLIESGNNLAKEGKYFALQYDEAGETMEGTKSATSELKAIKDYLRECGQYNSLTILVMPEFFDLPKGIALTRSVCLIDVYYGVDEETKKFRRGMFRFYSRKAKKKLYLEGKKELNYKAAPYNFDGQFQNFYPIDEAAYRASKQRALQAREGTGKSRFEIVRNALIELLHGQYDLKFSEMTGIIRSMTGIRLDQSSLSDAAENARLHKIQIQSRVEDSEEA